jgi:hypothetical protein
MLTHGSEVHAQTRVGKHPSDKGWMPPARVRQDVDPSRCQIKTWGKDCIKPGVRTALSHDCNYNQVNMTEKERIILES